MKATNVRFFIGASKEISLGVKVEYDGKPYYVEDATVKDVEEMCWRGNDEKNLDALMKNFCVYGEDWNDAEITEYHGTICADYEDFDDFFKNYEG